MQNNKMAHHKFLFTAFLLFNSAFAFASDVTNEQNIDLQKVETLSQTAAWTRLLHYSRPRFGKPQSHMHSPGFFLSANGSTDPKAEMIAAIQKVNSLQKVGKLEMPPICAFPERYRFLHEHVGLKLPENIPCEKLNLFLKDFSNPQSVSLVFSSAYPNNPSSMFGHTFLKFNSSRKSDLLDMGLNYAAVVSDDENPFAFFWFGVSGGYPGQWSAQPYYVKVAEYINFESRDLWEYELALTPEETQRLLKHIWEIEVNGNFEYYFFDENCSYQVLAALEAIKPEWTLLKNQIHVIPGESVKYLTEDPQRVRDIHYRPSSIKKIHAAYYHLNKDQQAQLLDIYNNKKDFTQIKDLQLLDALVLLLDYHRGEDHEKFMRDYKTYQESLLKYRAQLPVSSFAQLYDEKEVSQSTGPHTGHDAWSFQYGTGYQQLTQIDGAFASLKLKMAYHDLLNNDAGYTPFAQIDFPFIDFREQFQTHQFYIKKISFIDTISVTPLTPIKKVLSFRGGFYFDSLDILGCYSCLVPHADFAGGITVQANSMFRAFSFLGAETNLSDRFNLGHQSGIYAEVGMIGQTSQSTKAYLTIRNLWGYEYDSIKSYRFKGQLGNSWSSSRNNEFRSLINYQEMNVRNINKDVSLELNYLHFFN